MHAMFVFSLVPLMVLAFFVVVIVLIVRAASGLGRPSGGFASPLGGIGVQMGNDGFWIFSCPYDPGSILHYHYWANGVRRGGRVPYQPGADGRQFIYTGERPDRAAIVQVDELDDSGVIIVPPPIIQTGGGFWGSSSGMDNSAPSAPPPSSFPSAY